MLIRCRPNGAGNVLKLQTIYTSYLFG
ncbi:MAG: hypothetical protein ACI83I_002967, partial [Bacteroidia bacterium]